MFSLLTVIDFPSFFYYIYNIIKIIWRNKYYIIYWVINEEKNSVEDCIIKVDVDSEEVTELLDLEDLFEVFDSVDDALATF